MSKVLFMILNDKVMYLHQEDGDHREWYLSLKQDPNQFDQVIRGFISEGKIVFYKGSNFNYDEEVIQAAERYGKEIRDYMKDPHLEVWCGVVVQGFGMKWEPIMQLREEELSGVSNILSNKEAIEKENQALKQVKKHDSDLDDGPMLKFKTNYSDPNAIKRAVFVTIVVTVIAAITKIFMISVGIFHLLKLFDLILLFGQFGCLGYAIYCFQNQIPVGKYMGIGACIFLIFSFNIIDIFMAVFYFIFLLNQKPFEKGLNWILKI